MTLDVDTIKKRRTVMMIVNVLSATTALAAAVAYFKFALDWALVIFVVALLGGFATQIWFIAGLRGPGKGA
ncbi:MAG: hypothetical protein KKE02_09360 [Alphaproteobacteria bacterium]|nr:hypothetical protein [Alphaproteobacteria bacterium]MBU1513830.1 hypothetical protein [Alphaproteobacteria bacterium]MBU2094525.1 hypothetical protein [Alphaproteobacteria bacterium]MBU2151214.1 hypothetical protein [Alphaproteobacteria bacterium]MBU2310029.1 hypothetical protein [Alphaproteobacteria bacterium]